MINISAICDCAGTNPKQSYFVKGERILKARHIMKRDKNKNKNKNEQSDTFSFMAYIFMESNVSLVEK